MLKLPRRRLHRAGGKTCCLVIPTICRNTLPAAIESGLREQFEVLVVSDGVDFPTDLERQFSGRPVRFFQLGRNFGRMDGRWHYCEIPITVAAYLATTDFFWPIGDDDELVEGGGSVLRDCLANRPNVDIWVPGLFYKTGYRRCLMPGLVVGNVSHVCYRSKIFATQPMFQEFRPEPHDFAHVHTCVKAGWRLAWIGQVCVLVRPQVQGNFGYGHQHTVPVSSPSSSGGPA